MQGKSKNKKWCFPKGEKELLPPKKRERRKEHTKKRSADGEEATPYIGTGIISMKKK